MIFRQNLEEMLSELEKKQKIVSMELSQCLPGVLMHCQRNGKPDYIHVIKSDGKRIRKSINSKPDIIASLARKRYLQTELELVERNLAAINVTLSSVCDTTADNILRNLPPKYKELPQQLFFERQQVQTPADKWAQEPYQQSDYMPEGKVHLTSRGLAVRSKSELLIAEKLYEYNIPFRYEEKITVGKYNFYPDFTLLTPSGEIFYWEHCGLTANSEYMKKHKWKIDMYETIGIVPWKNLIVTYDDENGNLNLKIVESEIRNKLL